MSAVAKRYVPALLDVAREQGVLRELREDAGVLRRLLDSSKAFAAFVRNPFLPGEKRDAVLLELFGKRLQPLTVTFLRLLAHKSRLAEIGEMLEELEAALDREEGILHVGVKSAEPLLAGQQAELEKKLSERYKQTIDLHPEVDSSLIGGFRVQAGDQIEDYSLATKLETFKRNVINA